MDPVAPPGPWPRSSTTKGAAVTPSQESSSLLGTQKQAATSAAAKTLLTAVTVEAKSDMKTAKNFLREGPMVLKGYCFLACAACMAVAITQMIGNIGDPFGFIVSVYAFVFAFVGLILEGSGLSCSQRYKATIEVWMKVLARVWGRGTFYLLVAGMQFAEGGVWAYVVGFGLVFAAIGSFVLSYYASHKLRKLHNAMMSQYCSTTDEASVRDAFKRMDANGDGVLEREELAVLSQQLGVNIRAAELVAIFDMLDSDSDGKVTFDEFYSWWSGRKGEYTHPWV
tara:strand:+ start:1723 stop:2568 length:846 start_codon:yes stop_codon:yes gene_type:complete